MKIEPCCIYKIDNPKTSPSVWKYNLILNSKFNSELYVNKEKEFVFPNSAFTIELLKEIITDKITITFNLEEVKNINGIKIFRL